MPPILSLSLTWKGLLIQKCQKIIIKSFCLLAYSQRNLKTQIALECLEIGASFENNLNAIIFLSLSLVAKGKEALIEKCHKQWFTFNVHFKSDKWNQISPKRSH